MEKENGHRIITLPQPDDYEGKVTATLVSLPAGKGVSTAVLYVHGYIDYYFQYHMGEFFASRGKNFYALDLRKYGRSYMPHQHFNYCRHMEEYYPDIDSAIDEILADGNTDITLMGHSTGGLLASLYAAYGNRRAFVNRVILNSPFLEFNANWFARNIVIPIAGAVSLIAPYAHKGPELAANYFLSIHNSRKGEWDFDTGFKPEDGTPLYFAWLRAVRLAQKKVKKGLHIPVPVLVMFSGKSTYHKEWNEEARISDTVLNVGHIAKYGMTLGDNVRLEEIGEGLHDLVLSRKDVRERVLDIMDYFIGEETE